MFDSSSHRPRCVPVVSADGGIRFYDPTASPVVGMSYSPSSSVGGYAASSRGLTGVSPVSAGVSPNLRPAATLSPLPPPLYDTTSMASSTTSSVGRANSPTSHHHHQESSAGGGADLQKVALVAVATALVAKGLWNYLQKKRQTSAAPRTAAQAAGEEHLSGVHDCAEVTLSEGNAAAAAVGGRAAAQSPSAAQAGKTSVSFGPVGVADGFEDVGLWGDAASPVAPTATPPQRPAAAPPAVNAATSPSAAALRVEDDGTTSSATRATFANKHHGGRAQRPPPQHAATTQARLPNDAPTQAPLGGKGSEWLFVA